MSFATRTPCDIIFDPKSPIYDEKIRQFQGCPTIAVTKKGRIFFGWYSGGVREPHMDNYNILCYSDDGGQTITKTVCIIPSNKEHFTHALDIELWISPKGKLYVYWVQNEVVERTDENIKNYTDFPLINNFQGFPRIDGFMFIDYMHNEWCMICDDPDAEKLVFSEPKRIDFGFLRNKPLVLDNGRWINFNYDQKTTNYGYSISDDEGESWTHNYGGKKINTSFDEAMAYQLKDGKIRMLARTSCGYLSESFSSDNAISWTDGKLSNIISADTRFYIGRTPKGNLLMIRNNDKEKRTNLVVNLSLDDGKSWPYEKLIDSRNDISYPDVDFFDNKIYIIYDRERTGAKEILFTTCTEEDIMSDKFTFDIKIISKP